MTSGGRPSSADAQPAGRRRARRLFIVIAGTLGPLLLFLLLLEIVLRFLPVHTGLASVPVNAQQPTFHFQANREFVYSRNWNLRGANRGHTNNLGWVSDQEYDSTARTPLLALIGDSYVEAVMVPYAETMQARLAAAAGRERRVYAFGVSGAPLSQYLAEAEYAKRVLHPRAMAVVVVGNDFDESLAEYTFNAGFHTFRRRADGTLVLDRFDYQVSAVRSALRHSALARYVMLNLRPAEIIAQMRKPGKPVAFVGNTAATPTAKRLADSKRAVDFYLRELPAHAGLPASRIAFVVDAIRPALYTGAPVAGTYFQLMREYFIAAATAQGYEVIDMMPRFAEQYAREHRRFEFPDDGHWNALGHEAAARALESSRVYREFLQSAPDTTR